MDAATDEPAAGWRDAAGQVFSRLIDIGRTRLELVAVELEEERLRLSRLWIHATLTLFLLFIGVVFAAGWLVLLCDPADRLIALGGLSLLFLLAAALGAWRWQQLSAARPSLLHATLAQLKQDGG